MKKTRFIAAVAAAAVAASAITAAVAAYDLNDFDLGIGWSNSIVVPPEEFADLTADSLITVTFEADPYENEYWCLKPLVDDGGWQFIVDYAAEGEDFVAALSEPNHDTFGVEADMTSVTFKIPAAAIDIVKDSGLILMGHSLILKELIYDFPAGDIVDDSFGGFGEDDGFGGAEDDGAADDNGAGDTSAPTTDKTNANTGVEGVAAVAGIALLASAAVVISRKRK